MSEIIWLPSVDSQRGSVALSTKKTNNDLLTFLSFSTFNEGSGEYIAVEKSLPRIKGLKRAKNRYNYAREVVDNLHRLGMKIVTKKTEQAKD